MGILTGVTTITALELIFWFIRLASRIWFNVKGSPKSEPKKDSKCSGKKFLGQVVKKKNKNKKPVMKVSQKKIRPKQI